MCASRPADTGSLTPGRPATVDVGLDDIAEYLGHQRWFAGKNRAWQVTGSAGLGWLRTDAPAVQIVLVTVSYDDGGTETYQLPLVHRDEPVEVLAHALVARVGGAAAGDATTYVYDALHDKDVTDLWWSGITSSREAEGIVFHRDESAGELPEVGTSLVVPAEQSNTSLMFGDAAILKVFRKVSPGINPDIEIHAALAAEGSTHIATPLGWVEGRWPASGDDSAAEGSTTSLAMAQVFLRDASEGWQLATTSVRDLYAEADLHADEVGGDFAMESRRLGAATAEVHSALARAFGTSVLERKETVALVDGMRERLERAVAEVAEVAPYADGLRAAFDELASMTGDIEVQRIHGDFHLGQVMRTLDGWKLLDFEGEPARPLAERRSPDSTVKDVAGMLRSFDYAARHLLVDYPGDAQREYRASEWGQRNRDAFLDGYVDAGGADSRATPRLLRAYETDKAVYEAVYEARNRPAWLRIPMAAIARLAGPTAAEGTS